MDDSVGAYALMRVTGPADEWSCRDRILSLPTVGGTMHLRRVFLTAKPTPYSLVSFDGFPCQKNEKFFSLTDPESGSLVSCKATMSICSLLSSMSMTAVLRTSSISCRSLGKP